MNPAMLLKRRELGGSVRQNKRLLRRCPVTRDLLPLVARFDESVGRRTGPTADGRRRPSCMAAPGPLGAMARGPAQGRHRDAGWYRGSAL
jgi:hypothetical protein